MSSISRSLLSFKPSKFVPSLQSAHPFDLSLYLVANRPSFSDEQQFFTKIMQSVAGKVSCVQLRDHKNDISTIVKTALRLKSLLQQARVPLILNTLNLLEVAQAVHPDGLYLEELLPITDARNRWGQALSIGIPAKRMSEILAAGHKVHYVSVKVFASQKTCPRNDDIWGIQGLRKVLTNVPCPIVAIGGLTADLVEPIWKELRPQDGIAMAGGLMGQHDPCATAQHILRLRGAL
jgi:thiamine-phosphate diphosphorylase